MEKLALEMLGASFNPAFALLLYKVNENTYIHLKNGEATLIHVPKQILVHNIYEYIA